jgi:hypothetical protein
MNKTHTLVLICDDEGTLRVYDSDMPSFKGDQPGKFIARIPASAVVALNWWAQDDDECMAWSAAEATALLSQRLENIGYNVVSHAALESVIRRVGEAGAPILPHEVHFMAEVELPEPPEHIVYEVWGARKGCRVGPSFNKHTELAQATWHARQILERNGVGTQAYIVAHSSKEYH